MSLPNFYWIRRASARLAFAAFVALLWVAGPSTGHAQSVTERFTKAQRLFDQGQIKPAYKQLVAISRKYPDHQPTRLLLGRVFFRTGKVSRAAAQFKRISPDMLSGDAAYEYGLAFYQTKDYRRAKAGLARVPSSSKLADLAYFYRGLSHYQMREYTKAQFYLGRAKRLPKSLEQSKRQAMAALRRLLRNERRGGLQPTNPYLIMPTPPPPPVYAYPGTPPGADQGTAPADGSAAKEPPPPPPPKAGFVNNATPSFTWTQVTTNSDFHGTKTDNTEKNTSSLKVAFKSQYNASPTASGEQPYASLGVDLSRDEVATSGSSVSYKVYQEQPADTIETETVTALTSTISNIIVATPEVGFPIGGAIDLKGGYKVTDKDVKSSGKINESGPYGSVDLAGDTLAAKLTFAQTVIDNAAAKTIKTSTVIGGEVSKDFGTTEVGLVVQQTANAFQRATPIASAGAGDADSSTLSIAATATKEWETFSMTFGGTQKSTENTLPGQYILIGDAESLKLELSGQKTFEFGGSFTLALASEQLAAFQDAVAQPDAIVADGETAPLVPAKATGTRQTVTGTLKITPLDWVFASISLKNTTLALAVADPKLELPLQQKTPEAILETTIQAGVTKTF